MCAVVIVLSGEASWFPRLNLLLLVGRSTGGKCLGFMAYCVSVLTILSLCACVSCHRTFVYLSC